LKWDDYLIWKKRINIEMKRHEEVGMWKLVELPAGKNILGSCWLYAAKTNVKGMFELGKVRVAQQGFTQCPGMDYFNITSPVIKLESLHIMFALAIQMHGRSR
jgi:Reverse transcriptase (RNA-dependent DNA polymerase)